MIFSTTKQLFYWEYDQDKVTFILVKRRGTFQPLFLTFISARNNDKTYTKHAHSQTVPLWFTILASHVYIHGIMGSWYGFPLLSKSLKLTQAHKHNKAPSWRTFFISIKYIHLSALVLHPKALVYILAISITGFTGLYTYKVNDTVWCKVYPTCLPYLDTQPKTIYVHQLLVQYLHDRYSYLEAGYMKLWIHTQLFVTPLYFVWSVLARTEKSLLQVLQSGPWFIRPG
jgi:hypothetical protein